VGGAVGAEEGAPEGARDGELEGARVGYGVGGGVGGSASGQNTDSWAVSPLVATAPLFVPIPSTDTVISTVKSITHSVGKTVTVTIPDDSGSITSVEGENNVNVPAIIGHYHGQG